MKKSTKVFGAIALSLFLALSAPVVAQDRGTDMTDQRIADDDDGDSGRWGLLGLLGLIGLAGLKRKDRDDHRTIR